MKKIRVTIIAHLEKYNWNKKKWKPIAPKTGTEVTLTQELLRSEFEGETTELTQLFFMQGIDVLKEYWTEHWKKQIMDLEDYEKDETL